MDLMHPIRLTDRLSEHRCSIPNATYFITFCIRARASELKDHSVATRLIAAWHSLEESKDITLIRGIIMPDHVHVIFTLGERLTLSQVIGRFKASTRGCVGEAQVHWQRGFHDHRLRSGEPIEPFALYMFMNPYRAGLIDFAERWPWWFTGSHPIRFVFEELLSPGMPVPCEWARMVPKHENSP